MKSDAAAEQRINLGLHRRSFTALDSLRMKLRTMGAEVFAARCLADTPAIVFDGQGTQGEGAGPQTDDVSFLRTLDGSSDPARPVFELAGQAGFVLKRPGSPFPTMVNLGRAGDCDIVLPLPTVSKVHAYFLLKDGRWRLVDRRSKNGTFVNGDRLSSGSQRVLEDSDKIRFGKEEPLSFLLPVSLLALLARETVPPAQIAGPGLLRPS